MNEVSTPKQCIRCVLDERDDPEIIFDSGGICNHCNTYNANYILNAPSAEERKNQLNNIIEVIKRHGKGKKYDSILGLSGGVDSSYLAFKAKELGLNPLLVHFDNGWNSELAVQNIERIVNYTGFDLFTYVVDWEEFKNLQIAYIRASVLDWEIPTDHGFYAMLFDQAKKHKIKYILTGHNHQTEAILPKSMRWSKLDVANIKDIHSKYGKGKLKTFPLLSFYKNTFFQLLLKLERVNLLEMLNYNKSNAKKIIMSEIGWRDYGGKHYESIFTRFYQGFVLVEKFGFDKRKAHLSNLICSGQISKNDAMDELKKPPYDQEQLNDDLEYVIKKLGMDKEEFEELMNRPVRSHLEFESYETGLYRTHEKFMKSIRPITKLLKTIRKG